ncbi:MAG: PDZ domain-containing protein [Deltaproteobacteria bacterium]|nr:PDZ domain-containing protein [Deltaproteobacteria bacterium]
MRSVLSVLFVVVSPLLAAADESSNPAFLGVGMHDLGSNPNGMAGPCVIDTVTRDSGAHVAGLRGGDIMIALDTTPIPNCDALVKAIQDREAGQHVKIEIQRSGIATTLEANLPSRADVLRKRFVGKPMPLTTLMRVEDESVGDLTSRGKTTIVGWFDQSRCTNCASAFAKINDWIKAKGKSAPIAIYGVTTASSMSVPETAKNLKMAQRNFDVPLMVADIETFGELSITDVKRIHFMVIDCRGIVSYVTPLKPDADDRSAILEEIYAATDQAARRMK